MMTTSLRSTRRILATFTVLSPAEPATAGHLSRAYLVPQRKRLTMGTRGFRSVLLTAIVGMAAVVIAGNNASAQTSTYYVTDSLNSELYAIQGGALVSSTPMVYSSTYELAIAVYGDVRTALDFLPASGGGQYTLGLTPTGTPYANPGVAMLDGTTDGTFNYGIEYGSGKVYAMNRDWSSPTLLFGTGSAYNAGITYDGANNSLWVQDYFYGTISDYSLAGALLSSFAVPSGDRLGSDAFALAYDRADGTLWFSVYPTNVLEQYSTSGTHLQSLSVSGLSNVNIFGGEFDQQQGGVATPEPATIVSLGLGVIAAVVVARRRALTS